MTPETRTKIDLIKLYRTAHNSGLYDAKHAVEAGWTPENDAEAQAKEHTRKLIYDFVDMKDENIKLKRRIMFLERKCFYADAAMTVFGLSLLALVAFLGWSK